MVHAKGYWIWLNFCQTCYHLKIIQQRKNYVPFLSADTKKLMKKRDEIKKRATTENDPVYKVQLFKEYRSVRNSVKKHQLKDKKSYYDRKFDMKHNSTKSIWTTVRDTLKMNKRFQHS